MAIRAPDGANKNSNTLQTLVQRKRDLFKGVSLFLVRSSHIATEFQFFWKIAHFEVDWQALVFETSSFSNLTETI